MSPLRCLFISGLFLGLSALLLGLSGCGSGSSNGSMGPRSYTLTAAALNPGTVTAGNTSTSTITVTPANGYTGNVSLSCSMLAEGLRLQHRLPVAPSVALLCR